MPHTKNDDGSLIAFSDGEKAIMRALKLNDEKVTTRHQENRDEMEGIREQIARVVAGFPDGDPQGHRQYHDALIAESLARKAFWKELYGRLLEKGIWAVIIFLCGAVWFYLKEAK